MNNISKKGTKVSRVGLLPHAQDYTTYAEPLLLLGPPIDLAGCICGVYGTHT